MMTVWSNFLSKNHKCAILHKSKIEKANSIPKPIVFRHPLEGSVGFSPQRLYDSEASNQSNQTDDEKITDNIVNFAGNLVGESIEQMGFKITG